MPSANRIRALLLATSIRLACPLVAPAQDATGTIAGTVRTADGSAVSNARVRAVHIVTGGSHEGVAGPDGAFLLGFMPEGGYQVTIRAPGFTVTSYADVRVRAGETTRLDVVLAPVPLAAVVVARSPTEVDALDPSSTRRITTATAMLLPMAREASAAVALVPGAKDGRLWGGAGAATTDFRIDGAPMNHPGDGGDFLTLPREWVELVEIRGIGAGAEYGNFQGGVVDARLRRGSLTREFRTRAFHDASSLSASNLTGDEVGSEPAGRSELGAELAGPMLAGRLSYFAGVRLVTQARQAPDLATTSRTDLLRSRERARDGRMIARLGWDPDPLSRLDLTLGAGLRDAAYVGLDGLDAPDALPREEGSEAWYHATWRRATRSGATLELRAAGFDALFRSEGTAGVAVPSVEPIRRGLEPRHQNAEFATRESPASHSLGVTARRAIVGDAVSHSLAGGVEYTGTRWRERRERNGGLTWRPYDDGSTAFVPTDATTWTTVGSEWGGDLRLGAAAQSLAIFLEDGMTVASRLSVTAGVRATAWGGWLVPCTDDLYLPTCSGTIRAARTAAFDPRIGVSLDLSGRGTTALKAHAGRYHQGMYARLFDRVRGANAFANGRFHYTAPPLTDSRTSFTAAERDLATGPTGFSPFFDVEVHDESGVVRGYRQPYVDQFSLAFERRIGTRWKLEILALHRRNGDIVGLVDRNLASNYTELAGIAVDHRLVSGVVLDADGAPLVLDRLVVSNKDLVDAITRLNANVRPGQPAQTFAGWGPADIGALTWDPDIALSPVRSARRRYDQFTATLATDHLRWRGEGSLTVARLHGNVPGVTGHGATGTGFSAGPFVRPNEATNALGILPDATEFEGKVWLTADLPAGVRGGLLFTHILGERTTPTFTIEGRYRYTDQAGQVAPEELTRAILGQVMLVEPRGSRHYASRSLLDLHLERALAVRGGTGWILSIDLVNALGSREVTRVKSAIDDQAAEDPRSHLGAVRERVAPRALRFGLRLEPIR